MIQYDWIISNSGIMIMKTTAKYKAISVTVPAEMEYALSEVCRKEFRKKSEVVQEALRLYFRMRTGQIEPLALVMPSSGCAHQQSPRRRVAGAIDRASGKTCNHR
jgi:Arc/MetJ-type ribon-helix-helix transcriptional regulator